MNAKIHTAVHTVQYEAMQANSVGAVEVIGGWIQALVPEGETVDLSGLVEDAVWVLRHPADGSVRIIPAGEFALDWDTPDEAADPTFPNLSAEDLAAWNKLIGLDEGLQS